MTTQWRALSFTQPWLWCVLNLGKRCENRTRNIGNYRGPLLLHAAKRMTLDDWMAAYRFVEDRFGRETASRIPDFALANTERQALGWGDLPLGANVGRCVVENQCAPGGVWAPDPLFRGIHCSGQHEPADWVGDQERWYMGAHAWVLRFVEPTKVVPCSGALGFWRPPASVLEALGLAAA